MYQPGSRINKETKQPTDNTDNSNDVQNASHDTSIFCDDGGLCLRFLIQFMMPFAAAAAPIFFTVLTTVFFTPLSFCFLNTEINPIALRTKPKLLDTAPLVSTKGTTFL